MILVPLFDLKFLCELAAGGVGTSNRRHLAGISKGRHTMQWSRRHVLQCAAAAAASLVPRLAFAQAYPARSVRVIVPFTPGGPTDVFARLMAQQLSEQMGATFYVENLGGAAGSLGAGRAAQ